MALGLPVLVVACGAPGVDTSGPARQGVGSRVLVGELEAVVDDDGIEGNDCTITGPTRALQVPR